MNFKIIYLLIICTASSLYAFAQIPLSNLKHKNIPVKNNFNFDFLSVVPGTFYITGIDSADYLVDNINSTLTWKTTPDGDSVQIIYRTFPYKLNAQTYKYNYDSIKYNFISETPFVINANQNASTNVFDFGSIDASGSIGRSLTFGNSQDAVVNSSMNLQLHGFIGDSLELTAAISDNNIPIQPEGNTKDIKDFDRIYLQVKKNNWQVNLGDLDISENKNYFLKFTRRLQGINVQMADTKLKNKFSATGAIAKGKYNKQILATIEGNQGPYRLQGANNELYFVVLAGTERVYLDGELLQRGEEMDYVINYNTSEITFTPYRLITKDKRIQVEFEYADRNYLNSQIFISDEFAAGKKLKFNLAYFNNSNAKNSTIDQPLDSKQKYFLSQIGDSISNAYYTTARFAEYSAGKILYRKTDTIYNTTFHDSVYVLSSDENLQLYEVSFSYVGQGKGNYMPLRNAVNGQAFYWVSPDAENNMMGDWEPVSLLVTPKKLQIVSLGTSLQVNSKTLAYSEVALSKNDINTFSKKDKKNDIGFAGKLEITNFSNIRLFNKKQTLLSKLNFEYNDIYFQPAERLRRVEFYRDWSLPLEVIPASESFISFDLGLKDISYNISNFRRNTGYSGIKQFINYNIKYKTWQYRGLISLLNFSDNEQNGIFLRPNVEVKKSFPEIKNISAGVKLNSEYNKIKYPKADSISPMSSAFYNYEAFILSNEKKENKFGVSYNYRLNQLPINNIIKNSDESHNYNIFTEILKNENQQFRINASYRRLKYLNIANSKAESTLTGRTEYFLNAIKGFFVGNFLYEIGSGQEQKREFGYLEVPAGQGEFMWIDYNNNGIAELNEFEIAVFQDQKKYIRIFTPGNSYIKANYLQFNYGINLDPSLIISESSTGYLKFLRKISSSSALQINKKKSGIDLLFNPFTKEISDTSIISLNSYFSNTIFFNRMNIKWGLELTQSRSATKNLLAYGLEDHILSNISGRMRYAFSKKISSTINLSAGKNILKTANPKFVNRNYYVEKSSLEPRITYIHKNIFRAGFSYILSLKKNTIDSLERALTQSVQADFKYNVVSNSTISAKIIYTNINFKGIPNSTVGYVLLDGLLPGSNYLWSLDLIKKLPGNLELTLQYEGRKPGDTRIIHTGRAAIRAIF